MSNRSTAPSPQAWNGKWCTYCRTDSHTDKECSCTRPADWHPAKYEPCDGWALIPTGPAKFERATASPYDVSGNPTKEYPGE